MKITMRVPKSAVSSQEGQLAEWHAADGATIRAGEPLYSIEMEKTTLDVDAPFDCVVRHLAKVGEICPVGAPIAELTKI